MKTNFLLVLCLLMVLPFSATTAQEIEFNGMDPSPLDAAHYPRNAAFRNYLAEDDPESTQRIKVLYSRPQTKDRDIFGALVPYGQDWRLGANEATEVSFYQPVEIGGVFVPAGSYTLFAQVYPNQWIIKLSGERFIGGTANRDVSKDLVAVPVPTTKLSEPMEYFTIGFQKVDDNNVNMIFAWDDTRADLPINLNPPMMAPADVSPMDLVQYPPMSRLRNLVDAEDLAANEPQVRVVYGRPQMKGREIFGGLVKMDEVWRLGANETTEITFFKEAMVGGEKIPAGRYGLFAIPGDDEWEFIIHKNVQSWGNANHDDEDNIVSVKAKTAKTPSTLEALSMTFVESGEDIHLVVGWEDTMARLPIKVMK